MERAQVKVPLAMSAFSEDVGSIKASVQNYTIRKAFLKVTAAHPNSFHLLNLKGAST